MVRKILVPNRVALLGVALMEQYDLIGESMSYGGGL